jgi:hypothetical protein
MKPNPPAPCLLALTLGIALASPVTAASQGTRTTSIAGSPPSISPTCKTVFSSFSPRGREQYAGVPDWSRDPSKIETIRQTWKAVYDNDPRQHDPTKFLYLVTSHDHEWADASGILKYISEYPQREAIHLSAVRYPRAIRRHSDWQ